MSSGCGWFSGGHPGARPCTLSSLDTSAPFSFLAPCCHLYTRLGQEGTVKKKAKSCLYSKTPLLCTWRQGPFVIIWGSMSLVFLDTWMLEKSGGVWSGRVVQACRRAWVCSIAVNKIQSNPVSTSHLLVPPTTPSPGHLRPEGHS